VAYENICEVILICETITIEELKELIWCHYFGWKLTCVTTRQILQKLIINARSILENKLVAILASIHHHSTLKRMSLANIGVITGPLLHELAVIINDSQWCNRAEFVGHEAIKVFLVCKWAKELDYCLMV